MTTSSDVPAVSQPLATVINMRESGFVNPGFPYDDHTEEFYYGIYEDNGITAVTWNDIRFTKNDWPAIIEEIVNNLHEKGVSVIFSLSQITQYPKDFVPWHLKSTRLQGPWGNHLCRTEGYREKCQHSMLHDDWRNYLLDDIQLAIDAGVDGILIDELAYGSIWYPDFSEKTVQMFRRYLQAHYKGDKALQKRIKRRVEQYDSWGCPFKNQSLEDFDYALFIRDFVDCRPQWEQDLITGWNWKGEKSWMVKLKLPLYEDYERFLRLGHRETAKWLIKEAKEYAWEQYGKKIVVSVNVNTLHSPEAPLVMDLVDYVDLEWSFWEFGYFPGARASTTLKLAQAFGKSGWVMTSMATRRDLFGDYSPCDKTSAETGHDTTVTLYKTMIADAHAAGGTFMLEEGMHCILQDLEKLKPYYRFPKDHPLPFQSLQPVPAKLGVLLLFESLMEDDNLYDDRDYRGLADMLADSGYQFDVIFAAEDYAWWNWESKYPIPTNVYSLNVERLQQYPVIIIPELANLTENHAAVLIKYMKEMGGKLVILSTSDEIQTIEDHAQWGDRDADNNPLLRKKVFELIGYLRDVEKEPVSIGDGKLFWSQALWGREYIKNGKVTPSSRAPLKNILTQLEVSPEVEYSRAKAVGTFVYTALKPTWIWSEEKYLVVHFVNYDYERWTDDGKVSDTTTSVENLQVTIDLGDMFTNSTKLQARIYWPGFESDKMPLSIEETQGTRKVQLLIPQIDVWTAVVIEK